MRGTNKSWFAKGMRDAIPIALGYLAVSFTLGIAAKNAGFTPFQAFLVSFTNNASAGEFAGLDTNEANKAIAAKLTEVGAMLATESIVHQYPHCWRCHKPIIYRATEQWFCSVNGFKDEAIKAIENVKWIPAWGEERI